jgi:hypothetical protein
MEMVDGVPHPQCAEKFENLISTEGELKRRTWTALYFLRRSRAELCTLPFQKILSSIACISATIRVQLCRHLQHSKYHLL